MKRLNIFKNAMIFVAALALGAMNTACTDWDDHYDEASPTVGSSASSLWQNISANPNLSQFAAILQKTGYDKVLDAAQTYTVWAPVNDSFDYEALMEEDNDKVLREFVQNHIARNNYPATGEVDESIFMLNEKVLKFAGNGEYTFGDVVLNEANYMPSKNGVIHTLDSKVPFRFNIYESLVADEFEIDSISDFYHSYDQRVLNESKSVQGPPVDGKITYLDEVYDESNLLYTLYWAQINKEDSNYTMIVPTNDAWNEAREKISSYYKYIDKFYYAKNTATASSDASSRELITINSEYLRDSMIHYCLMNNLFFNNNLYDNKKLNDFNPSATLSVDSLVSTTFSVFYPQDAADLFKDTKRIDKSNGAIYIADKLNMKPWLQWAPVIKVEGESNYLADTKNGDVSTSSTVSASSKNPDIEGIVSNNRFVTIRPSSPSARPQIDYYLPGVRSTTYNIYVVTVPANIFNAAMSPSELKPTRFQIYVGGNDEKTGSISTKSVKTVDAKADCIDTVFVGEYTFPIAYVGTGYNPFIRVAMRTANNNDGVLRLDCIMLVPKELDEYKKEHPDYKYYQGGGIFYM